MHENYEQNLDACLARFFSGPTVRLLLNKPDGFQSLLKEFYVFNANLRSPFSGKTYGDLFEFAFSYLTKNYRNEYVYKNALTKNILLGKHSLNTSFMLQEFRVGQCKADTLVLNGTSNIYEIKSELDSLERLQNQVDTYLKAFDMVHVITFTGQAEKIRKAVPMRVGLMELNRRNNISVIREAKSGKNNICLDLLFDSLRKCEYQAVVKNYYGTAPDVPNTLAYHTYKELFKKIRPTEAHDLTVIELKKRGNNIALKDFVSTAPDYFKSLSVSARFSKTEMASFSKLLNSKIVFTG